MHRKLGLIGILLGLSLALGSTSAWAQVQQGSVFVKAVDEQKSPVPGATVTLTGPVLPRPLTGVTDSAGVYRFPSVDSGTYQVRIALQGFQTTSREDVTVTQGQTTTVDVTLKVGAITEVVTVRGETPVVDTKNVRVNVNLDSMLLETTPGGKDIWNILEYKVPGLVFDTPDVGGNQAGLQRGFTSRGTPNSQNVQLVNGVNVGDPAAIGFSMNYYEPSTFENISVTTGAQDISMGTSGTLINMVTRSGTNRFGGQTLATYQGKRTQWDNIDETLKAAGFRPEANSNEMTTNFNLQVGGPFVPNKLFYFGAVNDQRTHVNVPGYPAISPAVIPQVLSGTTQDTTDITSMSGKMTYALNGWNRFEGYANRQWYDKPNRGASAGVTLDSNTKEYDTFVITQISWNSVVSDRLFGDTKLAYSNTHFPLTQKHDNLQSILDNSTNVRSRNTATSSFMFRRRLQFTSNWSYYLPSLFGGRHELKFGFDNGYTPEDVDQTRVDSVNLTFRSAPGGGCTAATAPCAGNVTISNHPLAIRRAVNNTAIYGQDSFAIGRLNLIAGIRWERVEGFIPEQVKPASEYFGPGQLITGLNVTLNTGGVLTEYLVPETFARVDNAPLWKNWAPRVSGTYDLTGTGKTVLKASMGKYLDQIGTGTPGPNPNGTIQQTYPWNDINRDLVFQRGDAVWTGTRYVGGEFGNNPNQARPSIPNPNLFDEDRLRTWRLEGTAGVDHELAPGLGVSATYIYRKEYDRYDEVESNVANWGAMFSQIQVADPGRDGRSGTADDGTLTVYTLNPGFSLAGDDVNDDRLGVTYNGIELIANKRYANGLTFLAGYTYSRERQEIPSLESPNQAFVNTSGTSGGRRHNFKALGSYMFPYRITFGANFRISSGRPITRSLTVDQCSGSVTINCLSHDDETVNAEPRGAVELPALATIDVRAGRIFNLQGQRVELSMDVYNLTNANTVFNVRTGTGLTNVRYANDPTQPITQIATFLSPTGVLGPRIIRFNVTYWFGLGSSAAGRR